MKINSASLTLWRKGGMNLHITVTRQELLKAAMAAERIAPARSPVTALECALLVTEDGMLTIASTNQELALEQRIQADIREEGSLLVNAKWLAKLLKGLDSTEVTLRQAPGEKVVISGGTAEYLVASPDVREYPRMDIPFPGHTVTVKGIPNTAKRTVFAVGDVEGRPCMKCVNLVFTKDSLKVFGSDGFRIAVAKGTSKGAASTSMLLPAASFQCLAQLVDNKDALQVGTTGKTVVFSKENFRFSARLMDGPYLDADQIFRNMTPRFMVLTDAEQLRSAVASVTVVAGQQNRFRLSFQGNTLHIQCESEFGISSMSLPVTALSGKPDGIFWYHPHTLEECLKALDGTLRLEVAQQGVLLLKTEELICMQTAIREPKQIDQPKKKPKKKAA